MVSGQWSAVSGQWTVVSELVKACSAASPVSVHNFEHTEKQVAVLGERFVYGAVTFFMVVVVVVRLYFLP